MVAEALHDFKTNTILECMILNGKGCLTGCGLTGCVLHGTVMFPFFNRSIQNIFFSFQMFFCLS